MSMISRAVRSGTILKSNALKTASNTLERLIGVLPCVVSGAKRCGTLMRLDSRSQGSATDRSYAEVADDPLGRGRLGEAALAGELAALDEAIAGGKPGDGVDVLLDDQHRDTPFAVLRGKRGAHAVHGQ